MLLSNVRFKMFEARPWMCDLLLPYFSNCRVAKLSVYQKTKSLQNGLADFNHFLL